MKKKARRRDSDVIILQEATPGCVNEMGGYFHTPGVVLQRVDQKLMKVYTRGVCVFLTGIWEKKERDSAHTFCRIHLACAKTRPMPKTESARSTHLLRASSSTVGPFSQASLKISHHPHIWLTFRRKTGLARSESFPVKTRILKQI